MWLNSFSSIKIFLGKSGRGSLPLKSVSVQICMVLVKGALMKRLEMPEKNRKEFKRSCQAIEFHEQRKKESLTQLDEYMSKTGCRRPVKYFTS